MGGCFQDGVATLSCIPAIFSNVVKGFLLFAGTIAVIFIIYGGIRFITSGGDPKNVAGARQILTYAIAGLIIVLLSFAIVYLIGYLTNSTSCLETISKSPGDFLKGCQ